MEMRRFGYIWAACVTACLAAPAPATCQDASFGDQGFAFADFSDLLHEFSSVQALAVQSDGKIIAVGTAYADGSPHGDFNLAVARFTASGELDTTFGNSAGRTLIAFDDVDLSVGIGIQSDGRIVVAAWSFAWFDVIEDTTIRLARLTAGGQLDSTFGTNGRVTSPLGDFARVQTMKVRPDGRILVAGSAYRPDRGADFLLVQFRSNGALDTSFGQSGPFPNLSGAVTIDFAGNEGASALAIQSDGRIVVAGTSTLDGHQRFALARLTTNGLLDTSFGTTGRVTTSFSTDSVADGLALQADGRLVAVGSTTFGGAPSEPVVAVARYLPNGALDNTFSGDGRAVVAYVPSDPVRSDTAHAVLIQPDARIVIAGSTHTAEGRVFALARLTTAGTLDTSFGTNGRIVTDRRGEDALSIVPQASLFDFKFVVGGSGPIGSSTRFALARFFGFTRVVVPPGPGPF